MATAPPESTVTVSPQKAHPRYLSAPYKISSSDHLRRMLKHDLIDNITYDDPDILTRRLRIHEIDSQVVGACVILIQSTLGKDIETLKKIASEADGRRRRQIQQGPEDEDDLEDRSDLRAAEKAMYTPLNRIFSTITTFQQTNDSVPKRAFLCSPKYIKEEFPLYGYVELAPDIHVTNYSAGPGDDQKWENRDCFGEVKASNKQGPKAQRAGVVPKIVLQAADYARHYLTCRPFLLFCVGLLVFGTKFCIGIFDRGGIVFSPIYDMFDNVDIFVRVVRSVSWQLSIQELGLDPTIQMLTNEETTELTGMPRECPSAIIRVSAIGLPTTHWCTIDRPVWTSTSLLGRGTNVWKVRQCAFLKIPQKQPKGEEESQSEEEKIQSEHEDESQSEGEEESVSDVEGQEEGQTGKKDGVLRESHEVAIVEKWVLIDDETKILKTSWRNSLRLRESDLYAHIETLLPDAPGLAKLEYGGDVNFPDPASPKVITVQNLRNYPDCIDLKDIEDGFSTPVLHRIVISPVGDHVWGYDNDLHLLRSFRDAIHTHKVLLEAGILHRDISPGNIILVRTKDEKTGKITRTTILADLEYVQFKNEKLRAPLVTETIVQGQGTGDPIVRTHIRFQGEIPVQRGALMTGNAQFMALELLNQIIEGKKVKHEVHHDIESFIWSMLYSILRHITEKLLKNRGNSSQGTDKSQEELFQKQFIDVFGQTTLSGIATHRRGESLALMCFAPNVNSGFASAFLSTPLRDLILRHFRKLLLDATVIPEILEPTPLTYESVLGPIEEAIDKLENLVSDSA